MLSECASDPGIWEAERPVALDGLHGWFVPGTRRRGVLLVGAYGFEQICAYRPWRALARMIAATGCATLRLDDPGHGDSAGAEPDAEASVRAIRRGIAFLRAEAGAEEIVVIGLRLGATLAARAACEGGVDRLVLLAPFATGKAYLREMTMQSRLLDVLPDRTPLPQTPGALLVGSFHLGPEALASLTRIDLTADARPPAPRILLLGATSGALAVHYGRLGAAVETAACPELAPLVSDPLFAETPRAAFATVRDFACADAAPRAAHALPRALPPALPCRIEGPDWSEETAGFGPGLVGVLCRPRAAHPNDPAVLLVNSGRNVRSGLGRQTARLARRLAQDGVVSLRFDTRGVGDSADRPDGGLPMFAPDGLADVAAALDHLARAHPGPVVITGPCSGAYLAFRATCADPRIRAAILVNPPFFALKPGTDVEALIRDSFRTGVSLAARARQGQTWRRVLRGEITPWAIARYLWRDGLARVARLAARLGRLVPGLSPVGREIDRLRRRGARIGLIYAAGDYGLPALHAHLGQPSGREAPRLARRLGYPVTIVDGVDHNFSPAAAQDRVYAALLRAVRDVRDEAGARETAGQSRATAAWDGRGTAGPGGVPAGS